ncbi:MAG: hypothetical protein K5876_05070 [Ruminiclostridium sp.]|nr:hypothetical protein [Ruminiclostridium sp.]
MKNKGIAIELTALLDVILIMLFWVMMNMGRENERVKNEAAEQAAAYEQRTGELTEELEAAHSDYENVRSELDRYISENSESIAAANQKALNEFAEGRMITLNLSYDAVGKLFILDENGELGHTLLESREKIAESIEKVLAESGLGKDDVILCALVYDGDRALYSDVKLINAAADDVGKKYDNFYCTNINISR